MIVSLMNSINIILFCVTRLLVKVETVVKHNFSLFWAKISANARTCSAYFLRADSTNTCQLVKKDTVICLSVNLDGPEFNLSQLMNFNPMRGCEH